MITRADIISRDIDGEARIKLTPEQYEVYFEKTRKARQVWQQAQVVYSHLTRRPVPSKDGQTWGSAERQAASRFLEYQQALWSVLMSMRTGKGSSKQDQGA